MLLVPEAGFASENRFGDEIHIGLDLTGFDPEQDFHAESWGSIGLVSDILYSELFQLTGSTELKGELAESCVINPDKTVWDIHLKPGIIFHDGSILEARDVKQTFDSIQNNPDSDYHDLFHSVEKTEIVDDHTVRVTFQKHDVFFAYALQLIPITKPANPRDSSPLNGSGAYRFGSHDPNQNTLTLLPHENFFKHKPYLNKVVIHFLKNHTDGLSRISRGELDFLYVSDPTYESLFANDKNYRVLYQKKPLYYILDFNTRPGHPTQSKKFRQLLSALIREQGAEKNIFLPESLRAISYREHDFSTSVLYQILQSLYPHGIQLEADLESFPGFLKKIQAFDYDLAIYPADFLFDDYYIHKFIDLKKNDLNLNRDEKRILSEMRHQTDENNRQNALEGARDILDKKVPFMILLQRHMPILIHSRFEGYSPDFSEIMDEIENMWVPEEKQKYR